MKEVTLTPYPSPQEFVELEASTEPHTTDPCRSILSQCQDIHVVQRLACVFGI
jgi:hypothetical protein